MEGDVEVFNSTFDDPPEAGAGGEKNSAIYVQVPNALKKVVDAAAKRENLSVNSFALRCLERCVSASLD